MVVAAFNCAYKLQRCAMTLLVSRCAGSFRFIFNSPVACAFQNTAVSAPVSLSLLFNVSESSKVDSRALFSLSQAPNLSTKRQKLCIGKLTLSLPLHAKAAPNSNLSRNMPDQEGLEWVQTTFSLEPRWTKDPDIDTISRISRKYLGHDEHVPIDIAFYAQGAFNKLYKVSVAGSDCLMRVSLPVDPHHKTESEVATIDFVRKETGIPVSYIIAFDSCNQNELGFEWILMEMMAGVTLRKLWRKMSWESKENIVKQLVKYQAQLFERRFKRIGNIFKQQQNRSDETLGGTEKMPDAFVIGRIVSLIFFWGDHLTHDVDRGPFQTSYKWLQTRLRFVIIDQVRTLSTSTSDEDEIEDAEFALALAERLLQALPTVFSPGITTEDEESVLFHDDLSMENILVNEHGELTAIIDWECVSTVPLWCACQLPKLLEGRSRDEKPNRSGYSPDSDDEGQKSSAPDAVDNEGVNGLYWEHLLEYELTQLRKLFVYEMEKLRPEWVAKMKTSRLKADFEKAVHNSGDAWSFKIVSRWLDAVLEGRVESLAEILIS